MTIRSMTCSGSRSQLASLSQGPRRTPEGFFMRGPVGASKGRQDLEGSQGGPRARGRASRGSPPAGEHLDPGGGRQSAAESRDERSTRGQAERAEGDMWDWCSHIRNGRRRLAAPPKRSAVVERYEHRPQYGVFGGREDVVLSSHHVTMYMARRTGFVISPRCAIPATGVPRYTSSSEGV
jgi:hypothetical protein